MATPSLARTLKNFFALGPREYIRQLIYIGDPKPGTLKGIDQHGNKYYEDPSESFLRNRWVDYAVHDYNASQIPPEWHSWMSHVRKDPPTEDPVIQECRQPWQIPHVENLTGTRAAFKTYSTTAPKIKTWEPEVAERL
ncbi:NADH ubiquinone oxidoreductase subunit NDUFA12-domain-containing protein [Phakopsora pachyrhizi]|uniref:NADH dehydrogenase [ubiquinone] 1 alpha subcomplex subunit n=1 Tax=Phakopsora pachyrhizi TaxID=170000 RepID=A0AAV0AIL8_PHAPC|nr:NADH ubiquinone oxidoreductase subunit NDUFA12-domain-containing protein [Phakopsora pachyrhizi]CAH7668260.1 NADH ubiquinone oxidoreductase subunit NDUFA12-domain-containing protein [Phakopsora pachyrhizi]